MGDQNLKEILFKILYYLGQTSTVLGIITFLSIVWKITVPETQVEAILEFIGFVMLFQQFLKDAPSATSIAKWFLQPTTLRGLILSGSIVINRIMPTLTLDRIVQGAGLLLAVIEMVTNEVTRKLVFSKTE